MNSSAFLIEQPKRLSDGPRDDELRNTGPWSSPTPVLMMILRKRIRPILTLASNRRYGRFRSLLALDPHEVAKAGGEVAHCDNNSPRGGVKDGAGNR